MEAVETSPRTIQGLIRIRRVRWLTFPHYELTAEDRLVAHLGRDSSIRIFFGRGRRARLADGTEWRVAAATLGPLMVPIIRDSRGTVARSAPLPAKRSYGITGKHFAYQIVPRGNVRLRGAGLWTIRRHDEDVGVVDRRRQEIKAAESIPIAAALMAFTVLVHGIPGEVDLMPNR